MNNDLLGTKAAKRLLALKTEWGTWRAVAEHLSANVGEVHGVANGKRPPSRRLLLALGIVKPEKRTGIRVRMSQEEARELVEHDTIRADLRNRIRYALWGRK
jgi:hypothetical protein